MRGLSQCLAACGLAGALAPASAAPGDCWAAARLPAAVPAPPGQLIGALLCGPSKQSPQSLLAASQLKSGQEGQPDERGQLRLERYELQGQRWTRSQWAQDFSGPLESLVLLRVAADDADQDGQWEFYVHYRITRDGLDPDTRKLLVLGPTYKAALRGTDPKDEEELPEMRPDERFQQLRPPLRDKALRLWREFKP